MNIQKDYQLGYINGYLTALLEFYNLRFKRKNDLRLTHAFFIQADATGDLAEDVVNSVVEFHNRLHPIESVNHQQLKENLQLNPLQVSLQELGAKLEPWLPAQEQREIVRYHQATDFSPAFDGLVENVLEYVIRDYGLPGDNYKYWEADITGIVKLFFASVDKVQTIVFENGKCVCVLHFVREFL